MDCSFRRNGLDENELVYFGKQTSLMMSSENSHPKNSGSCGHINAINDLGNRSIPVTPHYNGQLSIFSTNLVFRLAALVFRKFAA